MAMHTAIFEHNDLFVNNSFNVFIKTLLKKNTSYSWCKSIKNNDGLIINQDKDKWENYTKGIIAMYYCYKMNDKLKYLAITFAGDLEIMMSKPNIQGIDIGYSPPSCKNYSPNSP